MNAGPHEPPDEKPATTGGYCAYSGLWYRPGAILRSSAVGWHLKNTPVPTHTPGPGERLEYREESSLGIDEGFRGMYEFPYFAGEHRQEYDRDVDCREAWLERVIPASAHEPTVYVFGAILHVTPRPFPYRQDRWAWDWKWQIVLDSPLHRRGQLGRSLKRRQERGDPTDPAAEWAALEHQMEAEKRRADQKRERAIWGVIGSILVMFWVVFWLVSGVGQG